MVEVFDIDPRALTRMSKEIYPQRYGRWDKSIKLLKEKPNSFFEEDLILIGGGHANLQVLKSFIMRPIKGLRVTLISDVYETPYSGMLPGFLENIYNLDDIFFDLYKICHQGQFRFIKSSVTGIKASQNLIEFKEYYFYSLYFLFLLFLSFYNQNLPHRCWPYLI